MPKGIPKSGFNRGWIRKGQKLSLSTRLKMKGNKNHLGKKHSEATKEKMSKNHSRPWLGKKHSKESKEKMGGEKHHLWKGEEAGYGSKHDWIARNRGKPRYCEECKRTDQKKYEWSNVDHKYRRVIGDYKRLCTKCHRKYDKNYN